MFITEIEQKQNGGHFHPYQPLYIVYTMRFIDGWYVSIDMREHARLAPLSRQLMKNRRVGVRGENWPQYPQIVKYRTPKIYHESYVAFGQTRQKSKMTPGDILQK